MTSANERSQDGKPKSRIKGAALALAALASALVLAIALGAAFLLWPNAKSEPLKLDDPEAQANASEFLKALVDPANAPAGSAQKANGFFSGVAEPLRAKMTEAVVKKALEQLRGEFRDLKTADERRRKALEIAAYIKSSAAMSDNAGELLSADFVKNGIAVYMRETTPAERALFDPIVGSYVKGAKSR